jgi:hypothetical protein
LERPCAWILSILACEHLIASSQWSNSSSTQCWNGTLPSLISQSSQEACTSKYSCLWSVKVFMKVSSVNLGKGLSWKLEAIFITTIVPRTWELDSAVYCSFLALCGKQQDWETAEWNLLFARASRHFLLFLNPNSKFYICKRHESNERSHALLLVMVFMWASGQHVCFKGSCRTFLFPFGTSMKSRQTPWNGLSVPGATFHHLKEYPQFYAFCKTCSKGLAYNWGKRMSWMKRTTMNNAVDGVCLDWL